MKLPHVDRQARPPAPVYLRRHGAADRHPGRSLDRDDAGRYLSLHRYPGRQRRLAVQRPVAGRDGEPHRHELRAGADGERRRHRAHRIAVASERRRRPRLLPSDRAGGSRAVADRDAVPGPGPQHAAGHVPAAGPEVRRGERADSPARAEQPDAQRAGNLRPGEQLHPHAARDRAGRDGVVSVRRQEPPDHGGPEPRRAVRQAAVADRRLERAEPSEPDRAGGHGEVRRDRISGPAEQQPAEHRRVQQPADQDGQRRDDLHEGRRHRARRLRPADQHRPHERRARRPADRDAQRQGVDAGRRQRGEGRAAEDHGHGPAGPEAVDVRRSVAVRARGHRRRRARDADRGAADRAW